MSARKRVLILCTGNSCRSQMAEGVLRHYGGDLYEVESAGSAPSRVHPLAIRVMKEIGIDISGHRSKHLKEFEGQRFDTVVTVCDNADRTCPAFPGGTQRLHWPFPDPPHAEPAAAEAVVEEFRKVRDLIHARFREAARSGFGSAGR
ncbi:MAG: Arsenate reductase [Candidatus Omnitrophica bacterium]|nr:Arsenate reductase [Candidatus Omnitrophota bacterium]